MPSEPDRGLVFEGVTCFYCCYTKVYRMHKQGYNKPWSWRGVHLGTIEGAIYEVPTFRFLVPLNTGNKVFFFLWPCSQAFVWFTCSKIMADEDNEFERPRKIPKTSKEKDSGKRLIVILENASLETVKVLQSLFHFQSLSLLRRLVTKMRMCRKRNTLWSKTKTLWSKAKTHWPLLKKFQMLGPLSHKVFLPASDLAWVFDEYIFYRRMARVLSY